MRSQAILLYSIPTFLLLICWFTMGVTATYDGDTTTTYGFPLNWYTPSTVASGSHEIAIGRLMVDAAIYALLTHLLWLTFKKRVTIPVSAGRIIKTLLSLAAASSLFVSIVVFSGDPLFTWWKLTAPDRNAHATHFIAVGLQPRPTQRMP